MMPVRKSSCNSNTAVYDLDQSVLQVPMRPLKLSALMRLDLWQLKNFMKQPYARRFVFCEFWYTDVDRQLYLSECEFGSLLYELVPSLATRKLTKAEWSEIRRLMGKPRRFSPRFLEQETQSMNEKRIAIEKIYRGEMDVPPTEPKLPLMLPKPPKMGSKLYVRCTQPRAGICSARVVGWDADGVKVWVESQRTTTLPEEDSITLQYCDLVHQSHPELNPTSDLARRRAKRRPTFDRSGNSNEPSSSGYVLSSSYATKTNSNSKQVSKVKNFPRILQLVKINGGFKVQGLQYSRIVAEDDLLGRYPLRFLVILVKLDKSITEKKRLLDNWRTMNNHFVQMAMYTSADLPYEFKERYSCNLDRLRQVNAFIRRLENALKEYRIQFPSGSAKTSPGDNPEDLRVACHTDASNIILRSASNIYKNHSDLTVAIDKSPTIRVVHEAVSFMFILRRLRNFTRPISAYETKLIRQAAERIRGSIQSAENRKIFDDILGVHIHELIRLLSCDPTIPALMNDDGPKEPVPTSLTL